MKNPVILRIKISEADARSKRVSFRVGSKTVPKPKSPLLRSIQMQGLGRSLEKMFSNNTVKVKKRCPFMAESLLVNAEKLYIY